MQHDQRRSKNMKADARRSMQKQGEQPQRKATQTTVRSVTITIAITTIRH